MDMFEQQLQNEETYNKTHAHAFLQECIDNVIGKYREYFEDPKHWRMARKICAALLLHKHMYIHNLTEMLVKKGWLDTAAFASEIGNIIIYMMNIDMVDYRLKGEYLEIVSKWGMTPAIEAEYRKKIYKVPMVIKPNNVNLNGNNRGSGYILDDNDSLILTHHHSFPIAVDVLNTLNQIPLNVETRLINKAVHTNKGCIKKEGELEAVYQERMAAWHNFLKQSQLVFELLEGKDFYLTHKYDTRGRCYDMGYHVHTQGDSYSKAVIKLANEEVVTDLVDFF